MGLFMAFQYPVAIPGVTVTKYLRMVMNAHREARGEGEISLKDFRKTVEAAMALTNVPREFASRYLNEGFSGGEKKRLEILQLALQRPEVAVLDETDSGLDIDALNVVAHGVDSVRETSELGVLIITHYQRILHLVEPTRVSVMFDGRIVKEGGPELVEQLEQRGLRLDPRGGRGRRVAVGALTDTALAHEFPVLDREGLVYLDSGATSQKPRVVIDAIEDYYADHNANIHRGVYPLAVEATDLFEGARERIGRMARLDRKETIFTKNATEAINLVAYAWGRRNVGAGDAIVLTQMEHHSNIVPWQLLCEEVGAQLRYLEVDDEGQISLDQLDAAPGRRARAARWRRPRLQRRWARSTRSAEIAARARAAGAVVARRRLAGRAADARSTSARSAPTSTSGPAHKAYGPTGIGVLHGRRELLEAMPPFLGGGDMISSVDFHHSRFNELPWKFEAGTSPIAEGVGLGAAVDFLQGIGMEHVRAHERELTAYALERLDGVEGAAGHGPRDAGRRAARSSRSRSTACTRTTSPRSSAATASASAPATTAPSR